jgi:hypothetical protein
MSHWTKTLAERHKKDQEELRAKVKLYPQGTFGSSCEVGVGCQAGKGRKSKFSQGRLRSQSPRSRATCQDWKPNKKRRRRKPKCDALPRAYSGGFETSRRRRTTGPTCTFTRTARRPVSQRPSAHWYAYFCAATWFGAAKLGVSIGCATRSIC